MTELDMTASMIEIPKYLKEDIRKLAKQHTRPGRPVMTMKAYLIELIAEKKRESGL